MLTKGDQTLDRSGLVSRLLVSGRFRLLDQRKVWIEVTTPAEVTIDQYLDVSRERTDLIISQRCGPNEPL